MKKALKKHGLTIAKYGSIMITMGIFIVMSGKSVFNWEYYAFLGAFMSSLVLYRAAKIKRNTTQDTAKEVLAEIMIEMKKQSEERLHDMRSPEEKLNDILDQVGKKGAKSLSVEQKQFLESFKK